MNKTGPLMYELRLKESLNCDREGWFEGMQLIVQSDGSTLLVGTVPDQSALLGMLNKIAALGLTLISVNPIVSGQGSS